MKRILMTLIGVIFAITTLFGQSFIGETKKKVLNDIKSTALKIEKPEKSQGGYYSITAKFQGSTNSYSFTPNDICYFYIIIEKYYPGNYFAAVKYYDNRYLRAFDDPCFQGKKTDVWKEPKGDTFIYRWILVNYNEDIQYDLFMTKENYEQNKYTYLQKILGQ